MLVVVQKDLYPIGVDWRETYSQIPDDWRDPYEIPTFTSPPWLIFLLPHAWLPPAWGLPLLAAKPQALGGVALIWWKQCSQKIRLLIPLIAVVGLSFLIWGLWPLQLKPVQESV